jgi:hypothetical protein
MKLRNRLLLLGALVLSACVIKPPQTPLRPLLPASPPFRPAVSVAFDREGNRLVAGSFSQTIKIGDRSIESAGGTDAFVAKFDKAGKLLWAQHFGSKNDEAVTGLSVDAQGNVIVGGKAQGEVDIAGQVLKPQLRGPRQRSLFVAKLDPGGKAAWVREVAVGDDSAVVDVAAAPDGKIATGVALVGPLTVQGKPLVSLGESISLGELSTDGQAGPTQILFASTPVACAHSPCAMGGPLNGYCNWCVGTICAQDPFCCSNNWDAQCASEVATVCGQRCDCNTCQAGQSINAYACACAGNVCAQDPYCCMHGWDGQCVQEVASFCGTPCR